MRFIIINTPREIKDVYAKMASPRTPKPSGVPSLRNLQPGIDNRDMIDILRERYGQALEYLSWFEPAWSSLTYTRQHIL